MLVVREIRSSLTRPLSMSLAFKARPALGIALLGLAIFLWVRGWMGKQAAGEKAFFYDVSAARLFTDARTAVPPIPGIDGPEEDGFRAVVVSSNGRPEDRDSWHVAYLERFSPELKQQMESAQRSGEALEMGRVAAQAHRFVRRLSESDWHPLDSPEAERILSEWTRPGPTGETPVLCTP
jgi:hypothetical protein